MRRWMYLGERDSVLFVNEVEGRVIVLGMCVSGLQCMIVVKAVKELSHCFPQRSNTIAHSLRPFYWENI